MDKLDLYKVIAGIDDETVDRAIETEEKLKRRKSILKKRIITVSVLAATFLIIAGAVAAIFLNAGNRPDNQIVEGSQGPGGSTEVLVNGDPTPAPDPTVAPDSNVKNDPADTEVFRFSSYDEMFTTLCKQNSSEHRIFSEKLDKNNYSSVFYSFIENLGSNKKSIPLPYLSGEPMEVSSSVEWQRISLFTKELFGLPWIWFYCGYGEQTVVVSLGSFKEMNIPDKAYSYIELIDLISPGFPQPNNKESFEGTYTDIEFQSLSLSGGISVDATVYYFKTGRVHYRFLIGDYIVSVWKYDGGTMPEDFWGNFCIAPKR
ncbi:MAG: hypothetical protein J6T65_05885 [Clostridia bacterium]|nr:hypothetical protein [Clostridia bacterium]MBP5767150.1 hypothetical protein [Clostridia bacterium]